MIANGALEEARRNLEGWNPALPSAKAIGAPELIDHLQGNRSLKAAIEAAKIATRQYAKRQRTWFRSKMQCMDADSFALTATALVHSEHLPVENLVDNCVDSCTIRT